MFFAAPCAFVAPIFAAVEPLIGTSEKLHSGKDVGPQNFLVDRKAVA